MATPRRDIKLIIVGKTGAGKSATGNTVLGRYHFKSSPCAGNASVTNRFEKASTCYRGRGITVVDCPGIKDTDLNEEDGSVLTDDAKKQIFADAPEGFDAFLLVFPFGVRYTKEYLQTVAHLKQQFGGEFFRFCILAFTHGDAYDATETGYESFPGWINTQEGSFKTLVEACGKRCVLFDNKTKDETKRTSQVDQLIKLIDQRSALGLRYTGDHLKMAEFVRARNRVEPNRHLIKAESEEENGLIKQHLDTVKSSEPKKQLELLAGLKRRGETLCHRIKELDDGTGVLKGISENIDAVSCVKNQMKAVADNLKKQAMRNAQKQEMKKPWTGAERRRLESWLATVVIFLIIELLYKETSNKKKYFEKYENNLQSNVYLAPQTYVLNNSILKIYKF